MNLYQKLFDNLSDVLFFFETFMELYIYIWARQYNS